MTSMQRNLCSKREKDKKEKHENLVEVVSVVSKMTVSDTKQGFDLRSGLSLIGGILMIISGALIIFHMNMFAGMMGNMIMGQWLTTSSISMGLTGIVCGAAVTVSAIMMSRMPSAIRIWGVIILIFSTLSFLEFGGFIIGAVLGIIGGIMALTTK